MDIRRGMRKLAILDLFMAGLLFSALFCVDGAAPAVSLLLPGTENAREAGSADADGQSTGAVSRSADADGQSTGAVSRSANADGQSMGAVSRSANADRQNTDADGQGGGDVNKRVALTFDDGPHPKYTEMLLDGLAEREVRATFFVTGANVSKYPEIVRRMQEEGHLIGNHTYHHIQLTAANGEQFREEIISTNEAIREVTGEDTEYIRPPYGSWDKKYEEELNMFPVLWTVDPRDWCSDDAACIVRNTLTRIKDNDIILMHDQYASSVAAALEIVDELSGEGYEFVTVEEILFD